MSRTDQVKPVHPSVINEQAPGLLDQSPRRTPTDVADDFTLARAVMQRLVPRRTPEAQADIGAARAAPTDMETAMQELDHAAAAAFRSAHAPDCGHAIFQEDCATCHRQPTCCARRMNPMPDGTVWCDMCGFKRIVRAAVHLDAALSNAALADTPAVREMGGPARDPLDQLVEYDGVKLLELIGADSLNRRGENMAGRRCTVLTPAQYTAVCAWHAAMERKPYAALDPANMPRGAMLLSGPEAERYCDLQVAARKAQASTAAARADSAALLQLFQAFCAGVVPKEV